MSRSSYVLFVLSVCAFAPEAAAQPLVKSAVQVDAGSTKQAGQTFAYRLTYNCSSTSGPCLGAEVVDLLPPEVQQVSTVPASPTGDVAAIQVTPNYMGTGRTRVRFDLVDPLPAGNSGDLLINVRFPNGSTPDGTVATNTADGINLETTPGTYTTPPVSVTAVAAVRVTLQKTLTSSPAHLDLPESYRLRISVPSDASGALDLTSVGPVVDTLPPGTVFNGATPAADCQPGCVGTTPATVSWTSPCSVPLEPGESCDVQVNVTFPSATFASGTDVTNQFSVDATPLGEVSQSFGPGSVTHPVTTFVPSPGAGLQKNVTGASPNPPTLDQTFSYEIVPSNNGNVPLDSLVLIDTVPVELEVASVTTGAYTGLADFAVGEGVRVSYEKNTAPGVFTLWGSSPAVGTSTTLTAPPPGLGAGEYVTRIRWEYGQAQPGMAASSTANRPRLTGRIVNPDNAGGPVAIGDSIQNCVDLTAVYAAGPTNVNRNACRTFTLSGPFIQLNPSKDNLSGGGPFNPGQAVSYRLRVRSDSRSSDPVPLADLVATDLLPVDLPFSGTWTFDAQGTGLPAPQVFEQIPNFAGTGRTLLRWRWTAGSGDLGVGQQVWINITTTVRSGAAAGSLVNDFTLEHDAPGLGQRCTGSSQADGLDLDGDADTGETLCRESESVSVAPIAQLVSSKTVQATCDGAPTATSAGTLFGGALEYRLRVENVGTVPIESFVLVDILPFVGDTGVRDTSARGSQWTPLLVEPITPPAGTVVYYSTSGNPCRGEVGGPVTGCDPPGWTTVVPEPITAVRSFKVEFGDRVVGPFDFVELAFSVVTPGDVPPGAPAYNSFAYQGARSDGLGTLAAEPQKVGVSLGSCEAAALGDFVWLDANGHGLQNDGASGVDGVFVELFGPGADGVPGTGDDVPLGSTATGTGPGGAAGWYAFPGLAPGDYRVCVAVPPTFDLSPSDAGGDDALDSDGDPATGCSPLVALAEDEDDPSIDFGLVATPRAALGDFVWFDRNGDGVQNESPFDGANGVTVLLFADDGDGVAEPAGDDPQVAATVTADDLFGRPGAYLFDDLFPETGYFVRFVLPASATGFTSADTGGDDVADSDASAAGTSPIVTLAPAEVRRDIDAGLIAPNGPLALGDQVWLDADDDGLYEPESGESGIDGVRLDLYLDDDGDGLPALDEYLGATTTATQGGFAGRYRFTDLAAGSYVVVVSPAELGGGGSLAGLGSSTGNDPAPDPDDDTNGDDNGTDVGALTATLAVTLSAGGEPTSEDGDDDTNLTVDLGFTPSPASPPPVYDYGDAPDVSAGTATGDYATTALGLGPSHRLGLPGAPWLGACVDADGGFGQDTAARADDQAASGTTFGSCGDGDDEDGVAFAGPFAPGDTASFTVTAGGGADCSLDAWVDWNRNGTFGDSAGEQIAAAVAIATAAPVVLDPTVPAGAVPGVTYARFRCSTAGGLGPLGAAADGEVEDHRLAVIGADFGDAPSSYGTDGAGAARHLVDPLAPLRLGSCIDLEPDGQPSAGADGDDGNAGSAEIGGCFDDEDGVAFTSTLTACQSAAATVVASGPGVLDAWIDFDQDGDFGDPGERIADGVAVATGSNPLGFAVPCTAVEGATYARFRISSAGGLGPEGEAPDGEVEDYAVVTIPGLDFGDAPDPIYPTLLASNGARHTVLAADNPTLGATVDIEADGQPTPTALGDDGGGVDDEDGVSFPGLLVAGIDGSISLSAGTTGGFVSCWIDFDRDGSWAGPGEQVTADLALAAGGTATPSFPVPVGSPEGSAPVRCRISSQAGLGVTGPAPDGEVEDHVAPVGAQAPAIGVAKRVVAAEVDPDDPLLVRVTFALRLENLGNLALGDVNVDADFATAFAEAAGVSIVSVTSGDFAVSPTFDGAGMVDLLAPGNGLGAGEAGEIEVVVLVASGGEPGPYYCSSTARGTSPADTVVFDASQEGADPDADGDGEATDDDQPTVVVLPVSLLAIPTLGEWMLALLAALLALAGLRRLG